MKIRLIVSTLFGILFAGTAVSQPMAPLRLKGEKVGIYDSRQSLALQEQTTRLDTKRAVLDVLEEDSLPPISEAGLLPDDDDERARIAKDHLRRLASERAQHLLKRSPLRPIYDSARRAVRKSQRLVEVGADAGPAEKPLLSVGVDPLKKFAPVMRVGEYVRVVADPWERDVSVRAEWRF